MNASFWHNLWNTNNIGFHNNHPNEFLLKFFSHLELKENDRIFIPLCGKTLDIKWLLDNGIKVVGIELNEDAIKSLFISLKIKPSIKNIGSLILYSAKNIDIFVGDIFELNENILGKVDAIYDRGAIVALPNKMREDYTSLLLKITNKVPHLIVTFEYDQDLMKGPPFSVEAQKLESYYNSIYNLELLNSQDAIGLEQINGYEKVWLLSKK